MKQPYTCICCGYETIYKTAMNTHLYTKKKPCPKIINDIELTDEIKQYILDNRIYKIPVVPTTSQVTNNINYSNNTNNIINSNNTVYNFIANMDTIEKITKYTEHTKIDIIDFTQNVEDKFSSKAKRLENNNFKYGFKLENSDFLDIINEISYICNGKQIEELNILYDIKLNRFKLFEDGDWEEMLVEKGIKKIIIILQSALFDAYEFYLIRNINSDKSYQKKQELKELLQEYYKFIGYFDVNPAVKDKSDGYILEDEDNDIYELSDKYWNLYISEDKNINKTNTKSIKKEVIDIIKRNTIRNIDEMNKKVVELFQVDEIFKQKILSKT